jgi:hypothetical protein
VAYKGRVLGRTDAKGPSEWSTDSAAEVPAGVPATPAAPSVSDVAPVGDQSQLQVNWTDPNNHGDAVSSYTLTTLHSGAVVKSQQVASGTSLNVTVGHSAGDYAFPVSAPNKAGASGTSAQSAPIRAAGKPGTVSGGSVWATGSTGQLKVAFTPLTQAQRNGSQASEIGYRWSTAYGSGPISAPGGTISGQPNGKAVTVNIIAYSTKNNISGDAKAIGSAVPHGRPDTPVVSGGTSAKADPQVHWTWNAPYDNGRVINRYEVSFDGGGFTSVGLKRQYNRDGGGWNQRHTLRVRACNGTDGDKDCGLPGSAVATSGADPTPPPPTSWSIRATPVRTCTEPNSSTDSYRYSNPDQCLGPGKWFDTGISAQADYYVRWGSSGRLWYHLTSGPAAGNFARGDTTSLGANPPAGMPRR